MPATRTVQAKDISQENREDHPVVQHLQRQLANALVLYANYKHYHWQTFGPLFRDLHLMFDEFAKDVLGTAAEFAERVLMIGRDVQNVQLRQMQEAASVRSASANQSMREAMEEADANLLVVIKEMREAAKAAEESNSPGTVDLFSRIGQIHEKHEWFVRDILKKKDLQVKDNQLGFGGLNRGRYVAERCRLATAALLKHLRPKSNAGNKRCPSVIPITSF
jgi:starvation-inducible DNA-binding protein